MRKSFRGVAVGGCEAQPNTNENLTFFMYGEEKLTSFTVIRCISISLAAQTLNHN